MRAASPAWYYCYGRKRELPPGQAYKMTENWTVRNEEKRGDTKRCQLKRMVLSIKGGEGRD